LFARALWVQLQAILSAIGYQPNRDFDVANVKEEILELVWDRKFYTLEFPLGPIDRSRWLLANYDFTSEHILGPLAATRTYDSLGGARMITLVHLFGYIESGGKAGLGTDDAIAYAIENAGHVFPALTVISPPPR
jgi:hypothetical protein